MERLLWFSFIRWSKNVAIGCVISFVYAEPPCMHCGKRRHALCGPATYKRHVKQIVCQRLCMTVYIPNWRMGDTPASWKGYYANCAVHNQITSVAESSHPLHTWGEILCCLCICSSCGVHQEWGMQNVHTRSTDFQLLVSGQHSRRKLELLP